MEVYTKYLKVFINKLYCGLINIIIKFNIYLNKYYGLYILSLALAILVFIFELLYSGNVIYCDPFDNDYIRPVEGDSPFPSDEVGDRAINEFDDRLINELHSRPITYQPYHPGLQPTSQGYRFELDGSSHKLPAELHGESISRVQVVHRSRVYGPSALGPPHSYQPSYRANPNSSPRVRVDDYYGIPSNRASSRIDAVSSVSSTNIGYNIDPIDSEFYRERYATNPFHGDTYHAAGESIIKKAKQSLKKFADYAKDDLAKTRVKAKRGFQQSLEKDAR